MYASRGKITLAEHLWRPLHVNSLDLHRCFIYPFTMNTLRPHRCGVFLISLKLGLNLRLAPKTVFLGRLGGSVVEHLPLLKA